MREIILKKEVLELILDERRKLQRLLELGSISNGDFFYKDEFLKRLYKHISLMGLKSS